MAVVDKQPVDGSAVRDYRDLAWRALDEALGRSQGFERRASALLSTVSGSLAVLIAALGLLRIDEVPAAGKWFATAGMALLVLSAALSILTMYPMNIRRASSEDLLRRWNEQRNQPDLNTQIVAQAVNDLLTMVPEGSGKQSSVVSSAEREARKRSCLLTAAMWFLFAALVCLACTGWAVLWVKM